MTDAHLQGVQKLYNEQADPDTEAMHKDPDVMSAAQALENAKRALNFDRYSADRQREVRELQQGYYDACNSYWRALRMAQINARKEEQRLKVEAENAVLEERRKEVAQMTPEKAALLAKYSTVL